MAERENITWVLEADVKALFAKVADNDSQYDDLIEALEINLCKYFNHSPNCISRAANIATIKGAAPGNKGLKMRLPYPGCGKSGGLRLAVEAACASLSVYVVGAWMRRDDPSDEEFAEALASARK